MLVVKDAAASTMPQLVKPALRFASGESWEELNS